VHRDAGRCSGFCTATTEIADASWLLPSAVGRCRKGNERSLHSEMLWLPPSAACGESSMLDLIRGLSRARAGWKMLD
jgi:hypothetical protein